MTHSLWLAACLTAGGLAGWPVPAQPAEAPQHPPPSALAGPASGSLTLREALDAAWQRAVSAREAAGLRHRADADRAAIERFWAAPPSLTLSHRSDRLQANDGKRETEIGLSVPLWLPGQRTARLATADAAAAHAQAAEQLARLRIAGEVREAAWLIAALLAEAAQADAQRHALRQLASDVERRVGAGDLAPADALAAQAEHLAATAQRLELGQRLAAARAQWAVLTGLSAAPALPSPTTADATADAVPAAAGAPHPALVLASQAAELARRRVDLLRHAGRDAPELTVGLRQDDPGRAAATQGSVVIGLRLPFGTDSRNRPLLAAAQADLDVAETQAQRLRERLDSDIAAARSAQQSAAAQHDAETARARLLRARAGLIDQSFRAGETPLPDLLRALAAAAAADSAAARQAAALGLAHARLQHALGLLP